MSDNRRDFSPDPPEVAHGLDETRDMAAAQESSPTIQELNSIVRKAMVFSNSRQGDDVDNDFLERVSDLRFIRELAGRFDVPEKIGNYQVLEPIGAGGMGQVFKVRHETLGKVQALKRLPVSRGNDPTALRRFKNEISTQGRLDHPNIVAAQYADEVDGIPFLIMDFVEGRTFDQLVDDYRRKQQPFPINLACELVRQAAIGIGYAHQQGIVHRDIKPSNLMLGRDGVVHVFDLGLARIAEDFCGSDSSAATGNLTREQQILGTPNYMAPEQFRNSREVDHRADIYSLGATLYYLLTGQVVHPAASGSTILNRAIAITNNDAPCVTQLRPDVPREVAELVAECLVRSTEDRLGTADEMAERLGRFSKPVHSAMDGDVIGEHRALEARGEHRKGPPSKGWKWLVAMSLAALFLLALIIKISLPGGGELIVKCEDPDAKIQVEFIQNGNEKSFELSDLNDQSVQVSNGVVRIKISGIQADEYELDDDRFTIRNGQKQTVSIRRVKGLNLPETHNVPGGASEKKEPLEVARIGAVVSSRIGAGAILQPAVVDEIFDVQLMPHPGMLNDRHTQVGHPSDHFDIAPQGGLLAFCNKTNVVVRELETNRIRALLDYPLTSFGWSDVVFDETGNLFAAIAKLNNPLYQVEIRTIDGKLIQRWKYETGQENSFSQPSMRIEWIHGKDKVLVWNEYRAVLYDLHGQQLNELVFKQDKVDNCPFRYWSAHPSGNYATVVCTDGTIRKWVFQEDKLSEFADTPWLEVGINGAFLNWSPKGDRLAVCTLAFENENVKQRNHVQIFDERGKELVSNSNVTRPFAWSPDGKFLTSSEGKTYDSELNEIRQVDLPYGHSPFWVRHNEIIGVRAQHGQPISVCRLSPSGELQEFTGPVQPLRPMGASWTSSGEISAFFEAPEGSSPLFKWKSDGQGGQVEFTEEVDLMAMPHLRRPFGISWSEAGDRIAMPIGPNHVLIVDSSGNVQAQVPVQPNASRFSLSLDGQRLAYYVPSENDASAEQGMVVIQNLNTNQTEKEIEVYSSPSTLEWSPDGKWLAGNVNDSKGKPHCILWGIETDVTQGFDLYRTGEVYFAFSPNGRFIAIGDGIGAQPHASDGRRIRVVDLTTWNESLLDLDIPILTRFYPVWSPDSKRLFAGCLCAVSEEGKLSRVGNDEFGNSEFATFSAVGEILVFGIMTSEGKYQRGFYRIGVDGRSKGTLPFREGQAQLGFASRPHDRPLPRGSFGSNRVALASSPELASLACLDAGKKSVLWNGLAFADGETVTLSADGSFVDGPAEIDRYLIHVIRYPGGRVVPLNRQQYSDRMSASPAVRALYWALDQGATINRESGHQILEEFDSTGQPGVRPEDVESLSLLNCKELSSVELEYLKDFPNLKMLVIHGSELTELTSLNHCKKLESVDLKGCPIRSLSSLPPAIKYLDLSGTQVGPSIGSVLSGCPGLVQVDLSGSQIDALMLVDLMSLSHLTRLDLRKTSVKLSDIESLSNALGDCEILVD